MKPGYLTTEFWAVILSPILTALSAIGIIELTKVEVYTNLISAVLVGLIALVTVIVSVYINARKSVKETELKTAASIKMSESKQLG